MTRPPRFSLLRSAPSRLLLHYLRGVLSQHVELVSDDPAGIRPGVGFQSPLLHQVRQRRRVPVAHRANPDAFGGHVWADGCPRAERPARVGLFFVHRLYPPQELPRKALSTQIIRHVEPPLYLARPPRPSVSSPPRSKGRNSGRSGFDHDGSSPARPRP